eukprot:gene10684-12375_t
MDLSSAMRAHPPQKKGIVLRAKRTPAYISIPRKNSLWFGGGGAEHSGLRAHSDIQNDTVQESALNTCNVPERVRYSEAASNSVRVVGTCITAPFEISPYPQSHASLALNVRRGWGEGSDDIQVTSVAGSYSIKDRLQVLNNTFKDTSRLSSITKAQWSQLMGVADLGRGPDQVSPSEFLEPVVEHIASVESMRAAASKSGTDESQFQSLVTQSGVVKIAPIRRSILEETTKWPSLSRQIKDQEERTGGPSLTYEQLRLLMAAHTAEVDLMRLL